MGFTLGFIELNPLPSHGAPPSVAPKPEKKEVRKKKEEKAKSSDDEEDKPKTENEKEEGKVEVIWT